MALIKCPECGKEISDQVKQCPHCGYPIKQKRNNKLIAAVASIAVIGGIGGVVYHQTVVKPRNTYNEAVALYNQENYDEALLLFGKISSYKDVADYQDLIAKEKVYTEAVELFVNEKYDEALEQFSTIADYKDVADYVDLIDAENVYQNAYALFEQGEYDAANVLFAEIADYKDVKEILAQMEADFAYNDYIDNVTKFGFFAETAVLQADDLLDDITSIWYNSIYEEDGYFTDQYTKDSSGDFYDDFNTALMLYFWSDEYSDAEADINATMDVVSEYYSKLKNPPDELKDLAGKVTAVQSSYNTMVVFAMNPEGNYSSVSEGQYAKKEAFNTAYNELLLAVPEKKIINQSMQEEVPFDFRHCNFGMTQAEILDAEKEYYGLDPDYVSDYGYVSYDGIEFDNGITAYLTYSLDDFRMLDSLWIEFPVGTTEEEVKNILSLMYGDAFDGEDIISVSNHYAAIDIYIDIDEEETTLYLNPVSQEDFDMYNNSQESETEIETEKETDSEEAL